jgi:hypothetical protein
MSLGGTQTFSPYQSEKPWLARIYQTITSTCHFRRKRKRQNIDLFAKETSNSPKMVIHSFSYCFYVWYYTIMINIGNVAQNTENL